jgi:hypothetical protein
MGTPRRSIYELNVALRGIEPPIWRQVQVWADTTLPALHRIIQVLFDWKGSHAHEFALRDQVYGFPNKAHPDGTILDEKAVPINRLLTGIGAELIYTYDFGDNWRHHVTLDSTMLADEDATYPRCIAGENAAPPENIGGPYAYAAQLRSQGAHELSKPFSIETINEKLRADRPRIRQ